MIPLYYMIFLDGNIWVNWCKTLIFPFLKPMSDVGDDIISTSAEINVFVSEIKYLWGILLFILKPLYIIATANRSGITMMSCHKLPQVYNGDWNVIPLFRHIITLQRLPFGGSNVSLHDRFFSHSSQNGTCGRDNDLDTPHLLLHMMAMTTI